MFPNNEYVLDETLRMHREEMMQAAAAERTLRMVQPARAPWLDQALATVGRVLVQLGQRLERRGVAALRVA
jgi:hypothetical protein